MSSPLQIQDMDRQQIAERHIVERYLAHQLTEAEAQAFEAYVEAHPEIIRDIEDIARMKSGLGTLSQRGELKSLVAQRPAQWYRHPAVLAASLAAVTVAVLMVLEPWRQHAGEPLIASTLQELTAGSSSAPGAVSRIVLSRSRSVVPEVLQAPSADAIVEVTLELFSDPAALYSVQLMRLVDGLPRNVAQAEGLRASRDGTLSLFSRGDLFTEGDYLIRVSGPGTGASAEFTLRVAKTNL